MIGRDTEVRESNADDLGATVALVVAPNRTQAARGFTVEHRRPRHVPRGGTPASRALHRPRAPRVPRGVPRRRRRRRRRRGRPIARGSGPAARAVLRRRGRGPLRDLRLARGRRRVSDERRRRRRRRRRARELASTTPRASSTSKKRAPPGSLDDDSVRDLPARASIDKRSRRGAPATPPRRDELTDPGGSVEYSDPNSDPSSAETNSPAEAGDPKEARLRRNRASAALSRQRKRLELVHLRQRCRELERAAAHFQFVAQQAFAENVDLRRRLDGVAGEVAGSNPVVAAASVVTRLPIPRTAPMQSTTTRGRRTGAADVYGENRGEAPSGAPSSGRAGEPFGADDAAYTLCDMPRVESRRRRGAASRSRRRGRGGVNCRRTRAAGRRKTTSDARRGTRDEAARDGIGPERAAPRRSPSSPSTSPPRRPPSPGAPRLLSHRTPK